MFPGNFRQFAQEYVEVMGDKPCAFQDLRPFISSLPADQVTEFLDCVNQSVGLNDPSHQSSNTVVVGIKIKRLGHRNHSISFR